MCPQSKRLKTRNDKLIKGEEGKNEKGFVMERKSSTHQIKFPDTFLLVRMKRLLEGKREREREKKVVTVKVVLLRRTWLNR